MSNGMPDLPKRVQQKRQQHVPGQTLQFIVVSVGCMAFHRDILRISINVSVWWQWRQDTLLPN